MFYQSKLLKEVTTELIYPLFDGSTISSEILSVLDIEQVVSSKRNVVTTIYPLGKLEVPKIVFIGLGERNTLSIDDLTIALSKALKSIENDHFAINSEDLTDLVEHSAYAINESLYTFRNKKELQINLVSSKDLVETIQKVEVIVQAQNRARDLVNAPSNQLTPLTLEKEAETLAHDLGVKFTSYDNDGLKELNAGGLLAVNQGSALPARLIVLDYEGNPGASYTSLVGKGITFDTGGYSLKPSKSMETMKCDMGGAAAVLGAFEAVVRLRKPVNLYCVIATTENMVSATAYKVDDVITMMNDKTVEITNTDAEGRLVLADGLVHSCNLKASRIIDVATLTGACIAALGTSISGVFANNDDFYEELLNASKSMNEPVWRLPLSDKVAKDLKNSVVADLVNSTGKPPGAIVAAEFLNQFISDGVQWIHLDIAGTAFTSSSSISQKGATGVMVKTLSEMF